MSRLLALLYGIACYLIFLRHVSLRDWIRQRGCCAEGYLIQIRRVHWANHCC